MKVYLSVIIILLLKIIIIINNNKYNKNKIKKLQRARKQLKNRMIDYEWEVFHDESN